MEISKEDQERINGESYAGLFIKNLFIEEIIWAQGATHEHLHMMGKLAEKDKEIETAKTLKLIEDSLYNSMKKDRDLLKEENERLRDVVNSQAEDESLWFRAETVTEAMLQSALRLLHSKIELLTETKKP